MSFVAIIPARYRSHRLPGKALLDLAGKPMIQRVFEQANLSDASRVIVATDDHRIAEIIAGLGGDYCMTSPDHPSGTDRIQEAARQCGLAEETVVVNIQGDEPLIPPQVINQVAANLTQAKTAMATLFEPIIHLEEVMDTNIVKLVADINNRAMYFSRGPIPWDRDRFPKQLNPLSYKRHVGIYAYRVSLLNRFVKWPKDELEQLEKLEQLRILGHGINIHVEQAVVTIPPGIDTIQDVERTLAVLQAKV